MTCERIAPLLSRYHDGALDARQRQQVQAHMASCVACTERLRSYERIESSISAALSLAPSPTFRQSVLAATVTRRTASPPPTAFRRSARAGQLFFGSVAGASIAALAILLFALSAHLSDYPRATQVGSGHAPVAALHHAIRPTAVVNTTSVDETPLVRRRTAASTVPTPAYTPTSLAPAVLTSGTPTVVIDRAALVRVGRGAVLTKGAVHYPLWSADGTALLYLTDFDARCQDSWYCGTLHLRGPRGSRILATRVRGFAFSPDGSMIAYTSQHPGAKASEEPQDLHTVLADGSHDRVLDAVDHSGIEWLRAGIVAVRKGKAVVVDPLGGRATPLSSLGSITIGDDSVGFMAVSANARFLAYQDATGLRIWDRSRAGTLVVSQPSSRLSESSFHFSWDGNVVFFSTYAHTRSGGGVSRLYRQQLAPLAPPTLLGGGWPRAEQINLVGPPSADSSIVSFRTGSGAGTRSYVVDAAGGQAHLLLAPDGDGPVGWWAPDGRSMIYVIYQGDNAQYSAIARVTMGS